MSSRQFSGETACLLERTIEGTTACFKSPNGSFSTCAPDLPGDYSLFHTPGFAPPGAEKPQPPGRCHTFYAAAHSNSNHALLLLGPGGHHYRFGHGRTARAGNGKAHQPFSEHAGATNKCVWRDHLPR